MDVKTALLNRELSEKIFMKVLDGVTCNGENLVCKLRKSSYGLKQSARCWFKTFEEALIQLELRNSTVDKFV